MCDIDHFKKINDVHGHQAGDIVLRGVSAAAKTLGQVIGRLGGEEFCFLVQLPLKEAVQFAESFRATIANSRFEIGPETLSVTCSFGVGQWQAGDTIDRLLRVADIALYEAKVGGRNRVVSTDQIAETPQHKEFRGVVRMDRRG